MESVSFYLLLALIIWLPVPLGSNRPWAWSIFQFWIAIQTIMLCWAYRYQFPIERLKPILPLFISLACFQLFTALQLVPIPFELLTLISPKTAEIYSHVDVGKHPISLDPAQTEISLMLGITYCLFILITASVINSRQRLQAVIYATIVSGTLQAFYAAMLVLSDIPDSPIFGFPAKNGATGSFVYRNHLANYLLLCVSLGLGCIVAQLSVTRSYDWQSRLKRIVLNLLSVKLLVRLCLIIMVIALVMTRSRMGNSALVILTIAGAAIALIAYRNRPRSLTMLMVSVIIIDSLIMGAIFGLEKVKQRIQQTAIETEARPEIFAWSIEIVKDFPLFGSGAGSFYGIFPSYHQHYISVFVDHAHNEYVQFLAEYGVFAPLLLVFAVTYPIYLSVRTLRTRESALMKGTALGCLMAIIGMLTHITVDFNLRPAANATLFILVLTLACIVAKMPRNGYESQ
nr:O-antigen ligase family protein [Grimontia sedimenti]